MMDRVKQILIKIFNIIYKIIFGYAKWVLAVVVAIVCAQVFCRNILKTNIRWNQEVSLLLTIWMAFLGIAIGAEKNLHIKVELFYDMFPSRIQKVVDVMNQIITLLVGAFFMIYGTKMAFSTLDSILPVTKWPAALMYIMIPISGASIIYFTVLDIIGLKKYKKIERGEMDE